MMNIEDVFEEEMKRTDHPGDPEGHLSCSECYKIINDGDKYYEYLDDVDDYFVWCSYQCADIFIINRNVLEEERRNEEY